MKHTEIRYGENQIGFCYTCELMEDKHEFIITCNDSLVLENCHSNLKFEILKGGKLYLPESPTTALGIHLFIDMVYKSIECEGIKLHA
jgi:hypothetical protein